MARVLWSTFTFDIGDSVWKKLHGEWAMPFTGRGYFDRDLDAFVGLYKDPETFGHLCSCDATSTSSETGKPAWKLGEEKVFSEDPAERHASATLVYMGRRSKFCLVECVFVGSVCDDQELAEEGGVPVPRRGRYLYRVATFSLRYDEKGQLRTKRFRARYYNVPSKTSTEFLHHERQGPVVFWL
ncbi:unnamed protein product [Urochloa humidicola]